MIREGKSVSIELARFVMSLIVCLHHFRIFMPKVPVGSGYLAVDFFFILSGFLISSHFVSNPIKCSKEGTIQAIKYFFKRYLRLWREYIVAFGIGGLVTLFFSRDINGSAFGYIKEALMIEFGCNSSSDRINPPDWYCGYLLMGSAIMILLFFLFGKVSTIFSLAVSLLCYILLFISTPSLCVFPIDSTILDLTIVRVCGGMFLGVFLNSLCQSERKPHFPQTVHILLSAVLSGVIFVVLIFYQGFSKWDYLVILSFFAWFMVVVVWNLDSCLNYGKCGKIITVLGSISFSIYLNHYWLCLIWSKYSDTLNTMDWKVASLIFLLITSVISGGIFGLISCCGKKIRSIKRKTV